MTETPGGNGLEADSEGYDGIIVIGPFNCLPYRISEAILKPLSLQRGTIAQGPLDEIRKLQAEVDEYLGLREPAATADALRETPSGGKAKGSLGP